MYKERLFQLSVKNNTPRLSHYRFCYRNYYNKDRSIFPKSKYTNYHELYSTFEWQLPKYFNIGYECSDYHVHNGYGNEVALIDHNTNKAYTFSDLSTLSNIFCTSLHTRLQISDGKRIAILLPQSFECALAHVSIYKLRCVAVPLFVLFSTEALLYRLQNSQCSQIITNCAGLENISKIQHLLSHLRHIIVVDADENACANWTLTSNIIHLSFESLINDNACTPSAISNLEWYENMQKTLIDDPALIIYTSGTTGNAKGCLHAHRVLYGRLPGMQISHNFLLCDGDEDGQQLERIFWTPADWAWIGGLLAGVMPSLYYGWTIIAYRADKFDVQETFDIFEKYQITSTFLPPTALKMMKMKTVNDQQKHKMLSVSSGGESLGSHLLQWSNETFGTSINEFYSQTECSYVISNIHQLFPIKNGSMGKAVPGHNCQIIDDDGNILSDGNIGHIAIEFPDPVIFLQYWNDEKSTAKKFVTNSVTGKKWLITGDEGYMDEDGYFWFDSRNDDVIISGGYRIGPEPIESICLQHRFVLNCAAIGKADDLRGEIVKLYVVLCDEYKVNAESEEDMLAFKLELHEYMKARVSKHEYPREIEFIDELPMTISGKVRRAELKQRDKSLNNTF